MTVTEALAAVREAAKAAQEAGELPQFLGALETVRAEILLAGRPSAEPPPRGDGPRLLTVREAAHRLGRSRWWIYQNKGALPVVRLPTGGYGFPSDRLDDWIRRRAR